MAKHHEWNERLDDGDVRFVRASLFGGRWTFEAKLKSLGVWEPLSEPGLDDLDELREQLWRKYIRGRVPHEHVLKLDALIEQVRQAADD